MCWEAESGDSKKNSHFVGEMHNTENGTQIVGAGSCSSHLKESQIWRLKTLRKEDFHPGHIFPSPASPHGQCQVLELP